MRESVQFERRTGGDRPRLACTGITLKEHRLLASLTQRQLAELSGVSYSTIHHVEQAVRALGLPSLSKVAKILGPGFAVDMVRCYDEEEQS